MARPCRILADSVAPDGSRIVSFECRHPTAIDAQINKHAMLVKSSRSFRAVPTEALIAEALADPYVPAWTRNGPGMVPAGPLDAAGAARARDAWLRARDRAVASARELLEAGVHKEAANRPLAPYTWTWSVITATDWGNFYALRTAGDAQADFRRLARAMARLQASSAPEPVGYGAWHLPYVAADEAASVGAEGALALSAARCARVSHRPFDGRGDLARERARRDRLVADGHWTPLGHQATPLGDPGRYSGQFRGWFMHRKQYPGENRTFDFSAVDTWSEDEDDA